MTLAYDHHVVIQNGYAILGFGKTEEDAIASAKEFMDDPETTPIYVFGSSDAKVHGAMVVAPCTAAVGKLDHPDRGWEETDKGVCAAAELK